MTKYLPTAGERKPEMQPTPSLRAKRSNPASKERMDCFVAEFIIGPAEGRTRWLLAMTDEIREENT
jgi:hypothetical protein